MSKYHLYFAACAPDGGVYHCLWQDGKITLLQKTDMDRPMYLDIQGNSLYVLLRAPEPDSNHSKLVRYPLDAEGALGRPDAGEDTQGVCACHLCHLGGQEYVVNYLSGNIWSNAGKVDTHEGKGVHPKRQEAPHTHFVYPSPDGKYLLSTDLGIDTIFTYDADLNVVSRAKVPAGHGCRHLSYSEDGRYVFCANELTSTVSVFSYEDGRLTLIDTVDTLLKPNELNTAAAIRTSGDYIYVSQRGEDAISVLKWTEKKLSLLGVYSCGGISPRDFIVLEDQLIITNEKDDCVSVLQIDGDTLKDTGIRMRMEAPLCVIAVRD